MLHLKLAPLKVGKSSELTGDQNPPFLSFKMVNVQGEYQKKMHQSSIYPTNKNGSSSFFLVTLWYPKWRSLNPWKGHLKHPERSLGRTWLIWFFYIFLKDPKWYIYIYTPPCASFRAPGAGRCLDWARTSWHQWAKKADRYKWGEITRIDVITPVKPIYCRPFSGGYINYIYI